MAGYVGWSGFDGATPVNLAECKVYDTAAEVWAALYADMEAFGWSHVPDDPEDREGPWSLSPAAVAVQDMERQDRAGTVRVGLSVWEVEYLDDDDIEEIHGSARTQDFFSTEHGMAMNWAEAEDEARKV